MLDRDLAELYEVPAKSLNLAVKRNRKRFPADFKFRLSKSEFENLRFQFETSKRGGTRYPPFAFTELGVAMLSGVLNSEKAIHINIAIMRAFAIIRQHALSHKELTEKLNEIESKYDRKFHDVYEALNFLLQKDRQEKEQRERKRIGFKITGD